MFCVLKPYHKERIISFMNPERDPLGSVYPVTRRDRDRSAAFTYGFRHGPQGSRLRAGSSHDFIFAVLGEEWGFSGVMWARAHYTGVSTLTFATPARTRRHVLSSLIMFFVFTC